MVKSQPDEEEEDDTTNSSWGDTLAFAVVDCLGVNPMSETLTSIPTAEKKKKKKVSFGGKAHRKTTIALHLYTKEEYYNTWYTPEETKPMGLTTDCPTTPSTPDSSIDDLEPLLLKDTENNDDVKFDGDNDGSYPSSSSTTSRTRRYANMFVRCLHYQKVQHA